LKVNQWWKDKVVYQIYPRSFYDSNDDGFGDINGIIEKLPYLADLGVNIVWLSPVYDSPDDDNGYDIRDYYSISKKFGTMEDMERLFEYAKIYNIKIMMDIVVNHTSDEHYWFQESKKSKNNRYRDYYIWKDPKEDNLPPNNWGSSFGGSAWELDKNTNQYYLHVFGKKQPDLNWENKELRKDIYSMMNFWIDKGVSGFRLDVINMISKHQNFPEGKLRNNGWGRGSPYYYNGPRIHEFLKEMHNEVFKGNDLIVVGEMPRLTIEDAIKYTDPNRNELDMIFHFEHTRLGEGRQGKWTPEEWSLSELKKIMADWQYGLNDKGWNSLYWSNHDQPRAISRFGNDSTEYREISGKMLAICLHMHKGTPYIYQGEEIGMINPYFDNLYDYRDTEVINNYRQLTKSGYLNHNEMMKGIKERSRDTARTPMQWNNEKNAGFSECTPWIPVNKSFTSVNVEKAKNDKNSIFYLYKKLVSLRQELSIIVEGEYNIINLKDDEVYAFTREYNNERLIVICNFTDKKLVRDFKSYKINEENILINNYNQFSKDNEGNIVLLPYQSLVFYNK